MSIERLIKEFGATEGPNKALFAKRDGIAHMVAYWDAHAGYHRISDGGTAFLDSAPAAQAVKPPAEVVKEVMQVAAEAVKPKLGLPGKK